MNLDNLDAHTHLLLQTIRRGRALSNDETIDQFKHLWAGDESVRESTIDGNMHWVLDLVEQMNGEPEIPVGELIAEGRVALARIIHDPRMETASRRI